MPKPSSGLTIPSICTGQCGPYLQNTTYHLYRKTEGFGALLLETEQGGADCGKTGLKEWIHFISDVIN
jgi:hypothetical protein